MAAPPVLFGFPGVQPYMEICVMTMFITGILSALFVVMAVIVCAGGGVRRLA